MTKFLEILKSLNIQPLTVAAKAGHIGAIVLLAFVIYLIFVRALTKLEGILFESKMKSHRPAQAQRAKTVVGLIRQVGTVLISVFAVISVLDQLTIDVRPVLAGAGVVGLAVGFGAQSLVKDFFTGLCLILENQITVGDWVSINGKSGTVEVLNFRITTLRDSDGTVHIFPNGAIGSLSNSTHSWSAAVLDLPFPRTLTLDQARELFMEVGKDLAEDEAWKEIVTEGPIFQGIQDITDRGPIGRIRFLTTPGSHWSLGREYRKRLLERFEQDKLPVPVTLRLQTDLKPDSAA